MAKTNIYGSLWVDLSERADKVLTYASQVDGIHSSPTDSTPLDFSNVTWGADRAIGNQYDINKYFYNAISTGIGGDAVKVLKFQGVVTNATVGGADGLPTADSASVGDVYHLNTSVTVGTDPDTVTYQVGDEVVCIADGDTQRWELLGRNSSFSDGAAIVQIVPFKYYDNAGVEITDNTTDRDIVKLGWRSYSDAEATYSQIPIARGVTIGVASKVSYYQSGLLSAADKKFMDTKEFYIETSFVQGKVIHNELTGKDTIQSHSLYLDHTTDTLTNDGIVKPSVADEFANYQEIPSATHDFDGVLSYLDKQRLDIANKFMYISTYIGAVTGEGNTTTTVYPWSDSVKNTVFNYDANNYSGTAGSASNVTVGWPQVGYVYHCTGAINLPDRTGTATDFASGDDLLCTAITTVATEEESQWSVTADSTTTYYKAYFSKFGGAGSDVERIEPTTITKDWLES